MAEERADAIEGPGAQVPVAGSQISVLASGVPPMETWPPVTSTRPSPSNVAVKRTPRSTIPPGAANVPFVHVEEDLTIAVPPGNEFQAYVAYVGFDAMAPAEKPVRTRKKKKS